MSTSESPAETLAANVIYTGSCHCNRFQYKVTQSPPLNDPTSEVIECNCSICSRNGYLFIYVVNKDVTFNTGALDEMRKYTFSPRHQMAHYFCPSCGTSCFAKSDDPEYYGEHTAVNVRTFEGIDLKCLNRKFVDGKSYNSVRE